MDGPYYQKLNTRFQVRRDARRWHHPTYIGPVIASPTALFFVAERQPRVVAGLVVGSLLGWIGVAQVSARFWESLVVGATGCVGALLGEWLGTRPEFSGLTTQQIEVLPTNDLPEEITGDPAWPLEKSAGTTLIVPRVAVTSMHVPVNGYLIVEAESLQFCAYTLWPRSVKARQILYRQGWPVDEES
jgi:uncharacterized membrane protein YeaQ/YmgE (transglycosylase-associated protein family)